MNDHARGPLSGVKVIDLTRALSGPYCTMLLADMGADVIKVESPGGDLARGIGPFPKESVAPPEYGGYFQSVNRNKRSIVLNLRSPDDLGTLRRLIDGADIVVENFRAGVMDSMGLSYEELSARNPALVYGAIRGFGDPRTGRSPHQERPAFDVVAQAMGGIMGITGPADSPTKIGPGVGDLFPATLTAVGILAALVEADRTGRGAFVDVAMYDAIVSLCERIVYQHSYLGEIPTGEGNDHPLLCPFGLYAAEDGWVTLAAPKDEHWRIFCDAAGMHEYGTDPLFATNASRVENRAKVRQIIESWTISLTTDKIVSILGERVPCAKLNTAADIANDPHIAKRQMRVELDHPGSPRPLAVAGQPIKFAGREHSFRRAPLLGEHTEEVLAKLDEEPRTPLQTENQVGETSCR